MTEYCACGGEIHPAYLPGDRCENCYALAANKAYPARHTTMGDTHGKPEPAAPAANLPSSRRSMSPLHPRRGERHGSPRA